MQPRKVEYAGGTNNSTVEQLVVVMRERTTTLESEQHHQMLLQLTYQRVTMTSILEGWSTCGGDPAVALHLRNTADYRLPTFGPYGTKLGHS